MILLQHYRLSFDSSLTNSQVIILVKSSFTNLPSCPYVDDIHESIVQTDGIVY
jgi:hypothetical protein